MISQPSSNSSCHKVLNDLNLAASPSTAPQNRASHDAETSQTPWFQAIARFARNGFLRVLLTENPAHIEIHVQVAAGTSTQLNDQLPPLLTAALASHSKTTWITHTTEAPFELSTQIPSSNNTPESTLRNVLVVLMKLGDAITNNTDHLTSHDIANALSFTPTTPEKPTPPQSTQSPHNTHNTDNSESTLFETIGAPTSHEDQPAPNIDHTTITQHENHLQIAIHLTILLRPSEQRELANALAHHLRARFDANVSPTPESTISTPPSAKNSIVYLDAEHASDAQRNPSGHTELAKNLEAFFKKAQEWAKLGIDIFELVGLRHAASKPDLLQFTPPTPATKTPARPKTTENTPNIDNTDNNIVFDLSSKPASPTSPQNPGQYTTHPDALQRGNFTDPRLKRTDATTQLVDLVLRHPGYSDRRIGQVLSIILSIDYHAALRLAENAPCVIAWGLARDTAMNYKDVIETTGGKALLVEPDSFSER